MRDYEVKPENAGKRLDVLVAGLYPKFSRSSMQSMFDKGLIIINGHAGKPSYKVKNNDELKIDESYIWQVPPEIDLPVLYEDDGVIVIDKPAGILTHSKGAFNLEPSVASFIKAKITDKNLVGNRAGIVHRLDRGTSGVIIAAKTVNSLYWLQKQFSQRKTKKYYHAIVEGTLEPKEAVIDAPIARNPKRPQTFKVMPHGKPAQTTYKVLNEFKKNGKNYSELQLIPLTGRTHQLRVHLAYIGHPIVGDQVYGHNGQPILLHAMSLELTLPNKKRKNFASKLPVAFKEFIDG